MRVGTICYTTDQGLGILARTFYTYGVVTDVLIVQHSRENHYEWYPGSKFIGGKSWADDKRVVTEFCGRMDAMLFFETPFHWQTIPTCRDMCVKTVLMPMHECMPDKLPYVPDRYVCPSLIELRQYPDNSVYLPVPVTTTWRQRTRAEVFVHNGGWGGLMGRNGTTEVMEAWKHVKSPAVLLVRSQKGVESNTPGVWVFNGTAPYNQLFRHGDVFLFPEKFNGLSLPLQEARASGMLVMGTDRFPMNEWLPREPLLPVSRYTRNRINHRYTEFDEAVLDPRAIAARVDEWYGRDISDYSLSARDWAEGMSWDKLRPLYMKELGFSGKEVTSEVRL